MLMRNIRKLRFVAKRNPHQHAREEVEIPAEKRPTGPPDQIAEHPHRYLIADRPAPTVADDQARNPFGMVHRPRHPDRAAPIVHHQRHSVDGERVQQQFEIFRMKLREIGHLIWLVGEPESLCDPARCTAMSS